MLGADRKEPVVASEAVVVVAAALHVLTEGAPERACLVFWEIDAVADDSKPSFGHDPMDANRRCRVRKREGGHAMSAGG